MCAELARQRRATQCGSEAGSYLRRIDFVSLNSRLESNKEEEEEEPDAAEHQWGQRRITM